MRTKKPYTPPTFEKQECLSEVTRGTDSIVTGGTPG